MADIQTYLQQILDAVYGEEVRGSIHDAIAAMNSDLEAAIQDDLNPLAFKGNLGESGGTNNNLNNLNQTDQRGIWRLKGSTTYTNVPSDFDNSKQGYLIMYAFGTSGQAASLIKQEIHYFSDSGANANIYWSRVCLSGEWQDWHKNVDSTLTLSGAAADAKTIGDKLTNITYGIKSDLLYASPSRNLYNPNTFRFDNYAIYENGERYESQGNSVIAVSIPDVNKKYYLFVKNGNQYVKQSSRWAMHNSSGDYIGMASNNGNVPVTITDNACTYCEIYVQTSYLDTENGLLILQTEDLSNRSVSDYSPFGYESNAYEDIKENRKLATDLISTQPLYTKEASINMMDDNATGTGVGTIVPDNGEINPVEDFYHSDYIDIRNVSGYFTAYTCNKSTGLPYKAYHRLAFYDEGKNYISGINNNSGMSNLNTAIIQIPQNAVYARIGFDGDVNSVYRMIRAGKLIQSYTAFSNESRLLIDEFDVVDTDITYIGKTIKNYYIKGGDGTIIPENGMINNVQGYSYSEYIPLRCLSNPFSAFSCNSEGEAIRAYHRMAFYNKYKEYISGINNNSGINDLSTAVLNIPNGAEYARIGFLNSNSNHYILSGPVEDQETEKSSPWTNKVWSAYGDSITAISNGDGLNNGWAEYVNEAVPFGYFYGRGIGGQSFSWRTSGGSACFINETTGLYNGRNDSYTKDNYSGTVPSGCVVTRGAFCSWDRIIHMYPESIKSNINMIFVMGGTNDTFDDTDLEWVANSTTDPEWANSSYYSTYNGDYNINTLAGGIASTILKMQAWMPNAKIVLGTPLNGQTNETGKRKPEYIPDEFQKSATIKTISSIFGCPYIDVFGSCGINVLNSPTFITDGTHPYNVAGEKMLAMAVIGGFMSIYPRIN